MKRRDIMKRLKAEAKRQGLDMRVTEGGDHTKVRIGDKFTTVPRHTEVNEITTNNIFKQMGMKR